MSNFADFSDEQLVSAFRGGDERAGEQLRVRDKNKVLAVARRFFIVGGDTEDLVQEGMCGLYSAMTGYGGGVSFDSYAHACIKNRIIDAVKRAHNNKNCALNGSSPLAEDGEGVAGGGFSPEEILIGTEAADELDGVMKNTLSALEYGALRMYIDGAATGEISAALGISYKQTDNALVRAKHKMRGALNM